jgi:hypothetical protein
VIPNASVYVTAGGQQAANQMCGLSGTQIPIEAAKLKELYKTPKNYASQFEKRVKDLEQAGWSLRVYRDWLLSDAKKVTF